MGNKNNPNGDIFDVWVKEAMEELGNHGWRDAPQNAVTLAVFGMMLRKVERKIDTLAKPAWIVGVGIGISAIWWIISGILGL